MTSKYAYVLLAVAHGSLILHNSVHAEVIAHDSASDPAYAMEAGGAWKGLNPTANENPPGNDNGGFGFLPWSFGGGYHETFGPYGNLNHFIDGVDFPASAFNALGAPAFGLANVGVDTGNITAVATRPFAQTLTVGDTFSVDLDTAFLEDSWHELGLPGFAFPFVIITFNDEAGLETLKIQAGASTEFGPDDGFYNWGYTDDTGEHPVGNLAPNDTTDGTSLSLEVTGPDAAHVTFDGIEFDINPNNGLPKSVTFTLYFNDAGDGTLDGSAEPTGEHEFFFDNLMITSAEAELDGDFDEDSDVDGRDFLIWQRGGSPTPLSSGDLMDWQSNYGSPPLAAAEVPEPSALTLGISAILLTISLRRHFIWPSPRIFPGCAGAAIRLMLRAVLDRPARACLALPH